jgi:hypothetical protein
MSKNPNYTGQQTFTIPYDQGSLINSTTVAYTPRLNMAATSLKQNIANWQNQIPDLIRPRPENMVLAYNFQPFWVAPPKQTFDLNMETERRSQDKKSTK